MRRGRSPARAWRLLAVTVAGMIAVAARPAQGWSQRADPARLGRAAQPSGMAVAQGGDVAGARIASPDAALPPSAAARAIPTVAWGALVPRWTAPIGSLLVPGLGQLRLRQDRFVAYAGAELYLWTKYAKDMRELHRQRQAYKTLARDVARYFFSRTGPDGDWDYYEVMGKDYLESGAYSIAASGEVVPETDPATYNGHIWRLALRTYWGNPDAPPPIGSAPYNEALALYKRRAVPPELRWSWRNSQLERDLYRRAISRANDSFRRATVGGSLIVANHLLSAVDAFVVLRLESVRTPDGDQRVGATVRVPVP
ncbi:MAG TPA: hypothetical protein VGD77_01200 [Gemmatimonadaceae bacterium]